MSAIQHYNFSMPLSWPFQQKKTLIFLFIYLLSFHYVYIELRDYCDVTADCREFAYVCNKNRCECSEGKFSYMNVVLSFSYMYFLWWWWYLIFGWRWFDKSIWLPSIVINLSKRSKKHFFLLLLNFNQFIYQILQVE